MIVMGFMTNRLNVSITGLQASSAIYYVPKWTEFAATLATIAAAVVAFRYAIIYLDILPKNPPPAAVDGFGCSRRSVNLAWLRRMPRAKSPGLSFGDDDVPAQSAPFLEPSL